MDKSTSTVWLLDDDPSVLKANGRLLASAGWEVERFIDPDAFLRHAEIHHPRVVVIDMLMPRMDGLEVQRRLSGISPSTRVIVLTANDDRIVRWKALAAGAAAFFIKPECGDEFLAGVRSAFACRHHSARHERFRGALSLRLCTQMIHSCPVCGNS